MQDLESHLQLYVLINNQFQIIQFTDLPTPIVSEEKRRILILQKY